MYYLRNSLFQTLVWRCTEKPTLLSLTKALDLVRTKCLELGSGVGFLGTVVAKIQNVEKRNLRKQGSDVSLWLTDCNEEVLKRCKENVYLPCSEF